MPKLRLSLWPLLGLLLLMNCSGATKISSAPAGPDFLIDGSRTEWTGRFIMPQSQKFAVGISHSKNYLYLALTSIDHQFQRQISMNGFTIWLDPAGKDHEELGLKYAGRMENRRQGFGAASEQRGVGREMTSADFSATGERGERQGRPLSGALELIVVDGNKRERLGPADLLATASTSEAGMFMEIQIPLVLLGPDYVPGMKLGMGVTSKFERPQGLALGDRSADDMAGGMGRGQMGGQRSGSGMRGGAQGGMGGHRPPGASNTDVDAWLKIDFTNP